MAVNSVAITEGKEIRQDVLDVLAELGQEVDVIRRTYRDKNGNLVPEQSTIYYGLAQPLDRRQSPYWEIQGMAAASDTDPADMLFDYKSYVMRGDSLSWDDGFAVSTYTATRVVPLRYSTVIVAYLVWVTKETTNYPN